MSFNPLTEAECGQKNPLARLTSHVTSDHGFSEARGQRFEQWTEDFVHDTKTMPQTYRMDDLMREMHEIESRRLLVPPVQASPVKDQLNDGGAAAAAALIQDDDWARQYIEDGKVFHDNVNNESVWAEIAQRPQLLNNQEHFPAGIPGTFVGPYHQSMPPPMGYYPQMLAPNQQQQQQHELDDLQSKEQYKDIWVQISKQEEENQASAVKQSAKELIDSVDDEKFVYSKFMKFMKEVNDGRLTENEAQSWSDEFLQNKDKNSGEQVVVDKEENLETQIWNELQEKLSSMDPPETTDNWATEYDQLNNAPKTEYTFSEDNPMLDLPNALERGKELLEEGDLPSAVLCFEAAVKQQPDNSEAWFLLGKTQAENEQDPNAIPALRKSLQLDPKNLDAIMALAVSYTNENYYSQAAQTLVNWLANNPKYSNLVPPGYIITRQVTSILDPDHLKQVQGMFIQAALRHQDNIDIEIQCGLGVLFNLSGDYSKAADCFRAALSVKPDDAKLWNRLGATLANGSKSEEAVDAYHHALDLEPGFIRARYNVGIICTNLRAYREAAEHFLIALNQQARGRDMNNLKSTSQVSETIWSTLRMCISLLNRPDLKPAVDNRDLETLNKEFNVAIDS